MAASALVTVDLSHLTIPEEEIKVTSKLIGEGAFAAVFEANWNGALVATKVIRPLRLGERASASEMSELMKELQRELLVACRLRHPNIVRLFGVYAAATRHIGLVMELLATSLYDRVRQEPALATACITHILHDMTAALSYLHLRRVLHRDISPRNTLLSDDSALGRLVAKLSDFATAKVVESIGFDRHSFTSGVKGTFPYLPYEAIDRDPVTDELVYSSAVDVYGLGAVGLFSILRKEPGGTPRAKPAYLKQIGADHILYKLLKECLDDDPRKRPSTAELQLWTDHLQAPDDCNCTSRLVGTRIRFSQKKHEVQMFLAAHKLLVRHYDPQLQNIAKHYFQTNKAAW